MRVPMMIALLALGACTPTDPDNGNANEIAPAEPAAVGSAQSGAEGQAMAEEQVKAAESNSASPPAAENK